MIASFKTKMMLAALMLAGFSQPALAQRGGVPALGYYRPCIVKSTIEKAEIIRPKIELAEIVRPYVIRPDFERTVIERPIMATATFLRPEMVRPQYLDPCLPVSSAAYVSALVHSSAALGVKFDQAGRIAKRPDADPAVAAMMPPNVAAAMLTRTDVPKQPLVPSLNTACCGEAPVAPAAYSGLRVRTRE